MSWNYHLYVKESSNYHMDLSKEPSKKTQYYYWLVVYLSLWKICSSVGMMTFPTERKNNPNVPAAGKPEQSTTAPPLRSFKSFHSRWDVLRLLQLWLKAQGSRLKPFNWLKGQSNQLAQFTEPNLEWKGAAASASWWGPPGRDSVVVWL